MKSDSSEISTSDVHKINATTKLYKKIGDNSRGRFYGTSVLECHHSLSHFYLLLPLNIVSN